MVLDMHLKILSSVFPKADIRTGNQFPILYQNESLDDTARALIIIISPQFAPDAG